MKKLLILLFMLTTIVSIKAQSYQITFEATGASTVLDSVFVENLTQGTNLKLLGNDTLLLVGEITSLNEFDIFDSEKIIYPNPIQDVAIISFYARQTGMVKLNIYDISGKVILKHSEVLSQGFIKYKLKGLNQGLYFISIVGENYIYKSRFISFNNANIPSIEKISESTTSMQPKMPLKLMVSMPYTTGEIMRYTGYSGNSSAIVTDIPTSSKTITFVFIAMLPTVTTNPVTAITNTTATSGGNVTFDGGSTVTARGVCYSTTSNPTTANSTVSSGSGTGSFTSDLTGLITNSTYYVRAYATNNVGTAYGNEETFTTDNIFSCGSSSVSFTYNGSSVIYGTVLGQNSTCWLDRNLGASAVATAYNHSFSYGDLFQWGRLDDGHQLRTSGISALAFSSTNIPGHSNFITTSSGNCGNCDWRTPQNNNLWEGVSGINNPCPTGWRLPTQTEFDNELLSWTTNNYNGAIASSLKLPAAGVRDSYTGLVGFTGSEALYWSSGVNGIYGRSFLFKSNNAYTASHYRAYGASVRCIMD